MSVRTDRKESLREFGDFEARTLLSKPCSVQEVRLVAVGHKFGDFEARTLLSEPCSVLELSLVVAGWCQCCHMKLHGMCRRLPGGEDQRGDQS